VPALKLAGRFPGPLGMGAAVIEAGVNVHNDELRLASGEINTGQFIGRVLSNEPIPGAKDIGDTIAGFSGDASAPQINFGDIHVNVPGGGMTGPQFAQAAALAAGQVYDQIIAAWSHAQNAPSSQLGGAH
jgi:hypothetical protein